MPESTLLSFDGGDVLVEVYSPKSDRRGDTYRGPGRLAKQAVETVNKSFDQTMDGLKGITETVFNKVREVKNAPDEVTLELGVKINAEANVVITGIGGEAHLKLSMKWTKKAETDASASQTDAASQA